MFEKATIVRSLLLLVAALPLAAAPGPPATAAEIPATCDQTLVEASAAIEPHLPGWGLSVAVDPCAAPITATFTVRGEECPDGTVYLGGNPGDRVEADFPVHGTAEPDGTWAIQTTALVLWGPTRSSSAYVFDDGLALWAICVPPGGTLGDPANSFGTTPFVERDDTLPPPGPGSTTTTTATPATEAPAPPSAGAAPVAPAPPAPIRTATPTFTG